MTENIQAIRSLLVLLKGTAILAMPNQVLATQILDAADNSRSALAAIEEKLKWLEGMRENLVPDLQKELAAKDDTIDRLRGIEEAASEWHNAIAAIPKVHENSTQDELKAASRAMDMVDAAEAKLCQALSALAEKEEGA